MARTLATLLLLLQLRPFAGAAICLYQSHATDQACEMTMTGTGDHRAATPHSPSTAPAPRPTAECPLAQLCAIPAGAVLSIQVSTSLTTIEGRDTVPSYRNTLFATDPAAPLVPPPNR